MPLLGLCPIGKFVFSHEDALKYKALIERKLRKLKIPFAGIDSAVKDGVVRGTGDIAPAIACLKDSNVDAVFMPHCNFGTEHAVGLIGRDMGRPALVWGPRDEAPLADGTRLRDTLCGLFASTKVLHKMRVPYTYLENCRIDDAAFDKGLDRFMRAANIAAAFRKGIRIGHIGQRVDFFWTTIINESELLDRFKIEVLPIDLVEFIREAKQLAAKERASYLREVKRLRRNCIIEDFPSDEPLINVLSVRDMLLRTAEKEKLDGIAFKDFMSVIDESGAYCSYAESCAAEKIPFAYESDIHGVLSCLMLQKASYGLEPAFLTEFTVRHPSDDNSVLMWHCGAPLSMRHPDCKVRLGKHWILPSPLSGMTHFKLKDGEITVCRFDGDHGQYCLGVGKGVSTDGPDTLNNYIWMKVDDWPRWERKLMNGPFIHHTAMAYGDYKGALAESCKYIPPLALVEF